MLTAFQARPVTVKAICFERTDTGRPSNGPEIIRWLLESKLIHRGYWYGGRSESIGTDREGKVVVYDQPKDESLNLQFTASPESQRDVAPGEWLIVDYVGNLLVMDQLEFETLYQAKEWPVNN